MNAQRLKQIEELFLAAIDVLPVERERFFRENCGADEDLRREVESLLAFENTPVSFLDNPPEAFAAEMFADEQKKTSLINKQVGPYKIKKLLGRGGMGEVYLAEDVRLNRQVALKFLSISIWSNKNVLRRFKQEAFSASALNHPNILTIYEFEAADDLCYLATEYIEGETLREKINREKPTIAESLNIAEQIALALAAAHKAKIIHRDIKPENIMVREDGFVKILDFGLAKLTGKQGELQGEIKNRTGGNALTKTGAVIGTTSYMSPEQIRGKTDIDGRTDIWSLGVVLFESLTGGVPFAGETTGDIIASILKTDSPPLSEYIAGCPPELERIIDKALAKNIEDRYQQIRDLASDISKLKKRLEFEAEFMISSPANAEKKNNWAKTSAIADNETREFPFRLTIEGTRTAIEQAAPIKKNNNRTFILSAVMTLILFSGLLGGLFFWKSTASNTAAEPEITNVSSNLPNASIAKPSLQLDYSLTVQSYFNGRYSNPFKLSGEMIFANRDRVRLNIESPQNGFLYVLNEGPEDAKGKSEYNILFPSPTSNGGAAHLSADREIQIPQESWFELDGKQGTEFVWLVWSADPIAELESAKRFANPNDRGKIKDPASAGYIESLLQKQRPNKRNVVRDDDKRMSQITSNADILIQAVKLEHY